MGSSQVEGDLVFAELDFVEDEDGLHQQQHHRDHRKHRKKKGGNNSSIVNGDADIVTPYQNGYYLNPASPMKNGYHRSPSEVKVHSDFLSPPPQNHHLLDERGAQSSLSSVNNAITVAPSRTNFNDSNVFVGGRPNNLKRPNHHHRPNNRHHHKHKGRSRTPDFGHRLRDDDGSHDSQSILNRIDLSIKKNFGDWDQDEDEVAKKMFSRENNKQQNNNNSNRTPYFLPKSFASDSEVLSSGNNRDDLNLPKLFKPYENVVTTSRQVLNDKSFKICLSRDNADPNSILSQAKQTLNYVSGHS